MPGRDESSSGRGSRLSWTAIVAAAGRGSRLGYGEPKILYPVAGRSILSRLHDLLEPLCERLVLVASPDGYRAIEQAMAQLLPSERFALRIQQEPGGMAQAVAVGLEAVETPFVIVVWGDQAALRPDALAQCARSLEAAPETAAVCPALWREDPYLAIVRDSSGGIVSVLQAREGDLMPQSGLSDAGVFFFRTAAVRSGLDRLLRDPRCRGRKTGELNFVPILALLARPPGRVETPLVVSREEALGINTTADAAEVERFFAAAGGKS